MYIANRVDMIIKMDMNGVCLIKMIGENIKTWYFEQYI
jgi:hypothetical protein